MTLGHVLHYLKLVYSFLPYLTKIYFDPLNAELKPICHLLALLAHPIFHVSRIRVKIISFIDIGWFTSW